MTKKNLNLAALICQAISIVLLFIPGMYNWEHWVPYQYGALRLKYQEAISFFTAAGNTNPVLGYLILLLMVVNLVILIVYVFKGSSERIKKIYPVLPSLVVVLMVLFSILASIMDDYGYCAPINWLFYVNMFFIVATTLLVFMRLSKNIKDEPRKVKVVSVATISNAEELTKYKKLLDMGVITQEEFDAKKKQILGL